MLKEKIEYPNELLEIKKLVEIYVLPLFSGAYISNYVESNNREKIVSSGTGYKSFYVKLKKKDLYRIEITRAQPFNPEDKELMHQIILKFEKISNLKIESVYKEILYFNALERAISINLSDGSNQVLSHFINMLSKWSERTYEGGRISFGFIIDFNQDITDPGSCKQKLEFDKILSEDFSAVLTDGVHSWIEFDKNGVVISHEVQKFPLNQDILCPLRFGCLADSTTEKRVGIVLLSNGEILLIKNKELKFAKRRGSWRSFHHNAILKQITGKSSYTKEDINKAIYLTALDVSFARSGGSICYTRKTSEKDLNKSRVIDTKDMLEKEETIKAKTIKKLVNGEKFHNLSRKLRQELMSIDGATIIDHEGNIIAAGSIIKIPSGSTGGGRLAATKALSKYGIAIKISEDGMIQGFLHTNSVKEAKEIFLIA